VAEGVRLVQEDGLYPDEAGARVGVSGQTIRRAIAQRRERGEGHGTAAPSTSGAVLTGDRARRAAHEPERIVEGIAGLRQTGVHTGRDREDPVTPGGSPGGTVSAESDAAALALARGEERELCRRILRARDPSALAELDAGLLEAEKGEAALVAWLARPLDAVAAAELDPLDAVVRGLQTVIAHAERLPPLHPRTAPILGQVANFAARIEKIVALRPRPETPDEVASRIVARRDEAVKKIFEHTREAKVRLEAERAGLDAWAAEHLGPAMRDELRRRVGLMLGGGPPE
jgi:hypothetical protein